MTKQIKFESLHTHTSDSDGTQTHLEVLNSAAKYGIGVIAFTEHDSLPSPKTLAALRNYSGPVRWLVGIELTSKLPKKIERGGSFHVLGLFTDPHNKNLLEHCEAMAEGRLQRMKHFVKQLSSIGLKISEDDCLEIANGSPVGSPHMVKALTKYPENQKVIDALKDQMAQAATKDAEIARKYEILLKQDPEQYPYGLFMKRSSFVPMPPAEEGAMLALEDSVKLIRDSGGTSVIAHWYLNKEVLRADELESCLVDGSVDGVETNVANLVSNIEHLKDDMRWLESTAKRLNVIETIGADSHYERDLEYFANAELAQNTIGMTAGIIRKVKPPLEWTNFDAKAL